jgi:hypothetical protein
MMHTQRFPEGWDDDRVQRLLADVEKLSEEEQVASDEEAAREQSGQAMNAVPEELLPEIRQLLASHGKA